MDSSIESVPACYPRQLIYRAHTHSSGNSTPARARVSSHPTLNHSLHSLSLGDPSSTVLLSENMPTRVRIPCAVARIPPHSTIAYEYSYARVSYIGTVHTLRSRLDSRVASHTLSTATYLSRTHTLITATQPLRARVYPTLNHYVCTRYPLAYPIEHCTTQ